jgi:anaerobic magnesium-protoporphyrin IX monomethyl ester cyclase
MTVFTTKGCPYKCGYCPYPYGFGSRLIYRSPKLVGEDIARLKHEFGVQQILFRDQVFTINPRHVRAVCEELIRRDLGVLWLCETRYDLVQEELLDLMFRAGCREIHYGLESADEEIFAHTAKADGPKSLELFERVIGWTKARGMRAHVHLIIGMPDESKSSVRNTTRWLRRVKPDSVQIGYYMPYPGTPMFEDLRRSGELGDIDTIDWEALGAFENPVIPSRHLSIREIRRARHRMAVDWQFTLADRVVRRLRRGIGLEQR